MWKDALTDLVDRTAPPPSAMPAPAPAARLTLGQLVERLTARVGGTESYQVDPALAPKPVCLFGSENAHPRAIFQSVARLYALDITQPTDNTFRLVVPRVGRVRGYSDVLSALRRCFPDPYQRYYHAQFKGRMAYMEQPENLSDFVKRLRKEDPKHPTALASIAHQVAPYVQDTIYDTAATRLRVEVEPRLAKAEDGQLKFRDAGVEAQRFFTLLCLVEIFSRLDAEASSFTTMPGVTDPNFGTWLGKFDTLLIQANISPDRMRTPLAIWDAKGERVLYRK